MDSFEEAEKALHEEAEKIRDALGADSVVILATFDGRKLSTAATGHAGNLFANVGAAAYYMAQTIRDTIENTPEDEE